LRRARYPPERWRGVRGAGHSKAGGTKLTCLTGHINKPGVYELRLGFPVKQMIEEVAAACAMAKS